MAGAEEERSSREDPDDVVREVGWEITRDVQGPLYGRGRILLLTVATLGIYPWYWLADSIRRRSSVREPQRWFRLPGRPLDPASMAWVDIVPRLFLPWWLFGLVLGFLVGLGFVHTVVAAVPGWLFGVGLSLAVATLIYVLFAHILRFVSWTVSPWLPVLMVYLRQRELALGGQASAASSGPGPRRDDRPDAHRDGGSVRVGVDRLAGGTDRWQRDPGARPGRRRRSRPRARLRGLAAAVGSDPGHPSGTRWSAGAGPRLRTWRRSPERLVLGSVRGRPR